MGRMAGDHALDALHIETRVDAPTNVLVIDDDEGVRDVLAAWVEADGCQPVAAESAAAALSAAAEQSVAVALCDVQMPGHDGFWFVEQVQVGIDFGSGKRVIPTSPWCWSPASTTWTGRCAACSMASSTTC